MISYIQGSLACHTRFVRNKYSEKKWHFYYSEQLVRNGGSWKSTGINCKWKREEKETGTHTWRNRSLPRPSPLQREKNDVWEAWGCSIPALPRSRWPCSDAARPHRSWSWGQAAVPHHHRNHSGKWLFHPQCSQPPWVVPRHTWQSTVPRFDLERVPIIGQLGEALLRESQGQAVLRALEEDWPLIPEQPHQTPPTASQSFLPCPQTSILPNDSLNSQVIQNSRRVVTGQAGVLLLSTYHSL